MRISLVCHHLVLLCLRCFLSKEGSCQLATQQTECMIVRGSSSILLEKDAGLAEALAYTAVESVLENTSFLREFTGSALVHSDFVRSIGESLAVLSQSDYDGDEDQPSRSSGAARVAIAAAIVSCVLTAIFLFGVYRKHQKELALERPTVTTRIKHMQAKRRKFFGSLPDDYGLEPGWMTTQPEELYKPLPSPSITWSVSDLTSDSHSIKSSLRMDRIEEEEDADYSAYEEEEESEQDVSSSSSNEPDPPSSEEEKVEIEPPNCISQWEFPCVDTKGFFGSTSSSRSNGASTPGSVQSQDVPDNMETDEGSLQSKTEEASTPTRTGNAFDNPESPKRESDCREPSISSRSASELTAYRESSPEATMMTPLQSEESEQEDWSEFSTPQGVIVVSERQLFLSPISPRRMDLAVIVWMVELGMNLQRGRRERRLTSASSNDSEGL